MRQFTAPALALFRIEQIHQRSADADSAGDGKRCCHAGPALLILIVRNYFDLPLTAASRSVGRSAVHFGTPLPGPALKAARALVVQSGLIAAVATENILRLLPPLAGVDGDDCFSRFEFTLI